MIQRNIGKRSTNISHLNVFTAVISLLSLIIAVYFGYQFYSLKNRLDNLAPKGTSTPSSQFASPRSEEDTIRNLISTFEQYIQDRNTQGIMSSYTPASSQTDREAYDSLMGVGITSSPRLFNTVTSNFIVTHWEISRRDSPDNKELIIKSNERKYIVYVTETRKNWCNVGACAGTYAFENTLPYVIEVVKVGDEWKVDKYYSLNQRNSEETPKYNGLNF